MEDSPKPITIIAWGSPASVELKVPRFSKGASGIEAGWIDGLGKLPPNTWLFRPHSLGYRYIQEAEAYEIAALLTTITETYDRVSMHEVRRALIEEQAESLGLSHHKVYIHRESTDKEYESRMRGVVSRFKDQGITTIAFGDIFLEDVMRYREDNLSKAGMEAVFQLWKRDSAELIGYLINLGFEAIVTCVGSRVLDSSFVGKRLDRDFISRLPSARWLSGLARGVICYKMSQKSTPIHTRAPFQS